MFADLIMPMDKLDQELILQLQKDGRKTNISLAKSLLVTEHTIRNRIKKLVGKNIIKITVQPNLKEMGYTFTGFVALQTGLPELRTVAAALTKHSRVCFLSNITGRYDLIAIIAAKSSDDFSDFIDNVISTIPGITRTETFINLRVFKGEGLHMDIQDLVRDLIP